MSGKGVLGNDPFKRGPKPAAAAKEPEAAKPEAAAPKPPPPPKPPEDPRIGQLAEKAKQLRAEKPLIEQLAAKVAAEKPKPVITPVQSKPVENKRAAPKPPPPPKIVVPKPKTGEGTPARRAVASFASAAPAPKVTAPERPSARPVRDEVPDPDATPPEVQSAEAPQAPQPPQPPPTRKISPTMTEKAPESHAGSPTFGPDPVGHAESPTLKHNPRSHAGSPSIGADPIAHASSPEGRHAPQFHEGSPELKAEFTPHETSPDMVAELAEGDATPHAGSPAVVAVLAEHEAVPHGGSPDMVSDRVTDVGVALEAARDVTAGLTRPLLEAATGLARAAKAALGFGGPGTVDTWGKDETLTRSLHPFGDFLYDKYFRVTVEGAELIPSGPSIIVANHSGALPLDGPMLHFALQRERPDLQQARWLVEDQVFHAPVLGVLMNRIGAVRAHPENAVRLLEEGRPVIVFPEGFLGISKPFTQRYQLKRFGRGGYVKLALKQRVPIVPVAIVGAEESMPLLAKLPGGALGLPYLPLTPPPLPSKWRIRFSEPVYVEGSTEDLAYVQEQNDRVRDSIAGMLTAMLGS